MKPRTPTRSKPRLTREDRMDLATARRRMGEKGIPFEQFVKRLKKDGLL